MMSLFCKTFLCIFLSCFSALAGTVDVANTRKLNMPYMKDASFISVEFLNRIQPKSVQDNESGHQVLAKMADSSVSYWWSTTPLRNSSIGRAAEALEKKAQIQAVILDENNIQHKFDFKLLVMQALARIEYKGWVDATVSYDAKSSSTEAAISQGIDDNKDLILSHLISSDQDISRLSLKFDW